MVAGTWVYQFVEIEHTIYAILCRMDCKMDTVLLTDEEGR
jgi:hypothetical protein